MFTCQGKDDLLHQNCIRRNYRLPVLISFYIEGKFMPVALISDRFSDK